MAPPIRLTVPGLLRYRNVAVHVVAEAAHLVSGSVARDHPFDTAVVSAFTEIFNNVAVHAYQRAGGGAIEIAITTDDGSLVIEVTDTGRAFDLAAVPPLPDELDADSLPEGGMGIHIAKTMLDEVTYEPGPPNSWRLRKRVPARAGTGGT